MRVVCTLFLVACSGATVPDPPVDSEKTEQESLTLLIPALADTTHSELADRCALEMPVDHECANGSPEVSWTGVPEDAREDQQHADRVHQGG